MQFNDAYYCNHRYRSCQSSSTLGGKKMRGSIRRLRAPSIIGIPIGYPTAVKEAHISSSSPFSTFSGSPPGRGRGRGGGSAIPFEADPERVTVDPGQPAFPLVGRGRGKHLPSSPFSPSFNNAFVAPQTPSPLPRQPGSGRGRVGPCQPSTGSSNQPLDSTPKQPIFFVRDELGGGGFGPDQIPSRPRNPIGENNLPESILGVLGGTGRGQPSRQPILEEENRHIRPRGGGGIGAPRGGRGGGGWRAGVRDGDDGSAGGRVRWNRDGALRREAGSRDVGSGQERGEGGRGRGRGRGRARGRSRGGMAGGREREWKDDERVRDGEDYGGESDDDLGWLDGPDDDAEAEKFAQKVGPEVMGKLTEAFDEMEHRIFPYEEENYLDALDMNLKIELEPEYLVEFENNPDIDEKPPISLEDALEQMKPFLMSYEGIQSQEEWEEAVKETMDRVPLLKQIVDVYSGPDRVTAKEQQEALEKVAKTLPPNAPDSVKRFTDRALLSLQ
ncbi:hypothetical protein Dimus_015317 [Dionaea muscipula]